MGIEGTGPALDLGAVRGQTRGQSRDSLSALSKELACCGCEEFWKAGALSGLLPPRPGIGSVPLKDWGAWKGGMHETLIGRVGVGPLSRRHPMLW